MSEHTVETSTTPHITVTECLGDLMVQGAEEREITLRLQDGSDEATLEGEEGTFTLTTRANCSVTCPSGTTLTIRTARGNLQIEEVQGEVVLDVAYGDVALRAVGPAAVDQVFGNLSARQIMGDLQVQDVMGNASVQDVEGLLSLGQVGANLAAEGLQGGLTVERVRGNVRLGAPFSPDAIYRINTSGNLTVLIPEDASLSLALRASGRVDSPIPGLVLEASDGERIGVLGEGEASLEANVHGQVYLWPAGTEGGDITVDLQGLGARIERRVNEALAEMDMRLAQVLGGIDGEAIHRRVGRATERARRAAERAAEQARRKAEREAERARMRAERAERRWRRASGREPRPEREGATDEERLRVLRLVEEGEITPEQASELLDALEG